MRGSTGMTTTHTLETTGATLTYDVQGEVLAGA